MLPLSLGSGELAWGYRNGCSFGNGMGTTKEELSK